MALTAELPGQEASEVNEVITRLQHDLGTRNIACIAVLKEHEDTARALVDGTDIKIQLCDTDKEVIDASVYVHRERFAKKASMVAVQEFSPDGDEKFKALCEAGRLVFERGLSAEVLTDQPTQVAGFVLAMGRITMRGPIPSRRLT